MRYLFLGFGLGTAVGVILEQKAGSATRKEIKRRVREGKHYLNQQRRELLHSANETAVRGKQAIRNQVKSLSAFMTAGKLAYQRSVDAGSTN
jgi:hypothetical protein